MTAATNYYYCYHYKLLPLLPLTTYSLTDTVPMQVKVPFLLSKK